MTLGWLWDGGGGGFVNFDEKRRRFWRPNRGLGPSQGVQGGTKEPPRRHQGGTREALAGFDRWKNDRHIQAEPNDTEQYISP